MAGRAKKNPQEDIEDLADVVGWLDSANRRMDVAVKALSRSKAFRAMEEAFHRRGGPALFLHTGIEGMGHRGVCYSSGSSLRIKGACIVGNPGEEFVRLSLSGEIESAHCPPFDGELHGEFGGMVDVPAHLFKRFSRARFMRWIADVRDAVECSEVSHALRYMKKLKVGISRDKYRDVILFTKNL